MGVLVLAQTIILRGILLCTLLLCYNLPASADDQPLQLYEEKIKAGLVYNLLKYTAWPSESISQTSGKLHICLFGEDPFDGYLSPLEGRTAQQTPIFISHVTQAQQTDDCSVVIIHRTREDQLAELLKFLKNKNILTISDIKQFAERGGMVEMSQEDEKINLYINKNAVGLAGLDIQERMLKLAKIVQSKELRK